MRYPQRFHPLFFACFIAAPCFADRGSAETSTAPRLAVVIAIDQFRGDYLQRFEPYFGEGGFKRLLAGGTHFSDCHFRHAVTKTAPGHATILSGSHADIHGIAANDWLDATTGRIVESVEDSAFPIVGAAPSATRSPGGVLETKAGRSPRRFMATTVGDQLKLRFGARAKVFSVSNKDRSAILLGGKLADSAYWMDRGRLVTSTYYRPTPPAWVEKFNAAQRAENAFGQTWDRLRDASIYEAVQGPDDAPGESTDAGLGRTFPRILNGGRSEISPDFFNAFDNSPHSAALIGDFASAAIREEQLGQDDVTDLLCISFSQIDTVGHSYGPDSHELMDSVLRLDTVIAALLDHLDKEVGLARCVIALTADHGASPLPERVKALSPEISAGRFEAPPVDAAIAAALDKAFGPLSGDGRWLIRDNFGYHFIAASLAEKNTHAAAAASIAKTVLLASPQIAHAFTRAEILAMPAEGRSLEAMLRRSFYPPLGQDVIFVFKPYIVDRKSGTNHGTPYEYDTHVPLVFFGAGVPHGMNNQRVGVDDLAPTLSSLLRLPAPPQSVGNRLF